jgi:hypothetical protein
MKKLFTSLFSIAFLTLSAFSADIEKSGIISADETWTKDNVYILKQRVFVADGVTLTIQPGTLIKGQSGDVADVGVLVISRGATLIAEGTASEPIVFTSGDDDGTMEIDVRGQWGGLIILGNGTHNNNDNTNEIEGITPSGDNGLYGGSTEDDNSGSIKYVSIRHGGAELAADEEINGLTLGAVGSKTVISHVEVVANLDDGIEWFGGSPKMDHIVVSYCGDDSYDYDEGYNGMNQFTVAVQDPEGGDRLGEHDGGPSSNRWGKPLATPVFSNATYIGRGAGKGKKTVTFRDNAGGEYHNSIFANQEKGIDIEYTSVSDGVDSNSYQMFASGKLKVANNVFTNIADGTASGIFKVSQAKDKDGNPIGDAVPAAYTTAWSDYFATAGNAVADAGVSITDPVPSNPVNVKEAVFTGLDTWFENVAYKGAFNPCLTGGHWAGSWTLTFAKDTYKKDDGTGGCYTSIRNTFVEMEASVFPNPASQTATINFENNNNSIFVLNLYNITGQIVKTIETSSDALTIDLSEVASGVYTYNLSNGTKRSTGKLIVN